MNNICKLLYALIFLYILPLNLSAQDLTGRIEGRLTDSLTKQPIEYVSIALKKDHTAIKTSITSENGSFLIPDVPFGKYTLTAIATGFHSKTINLELNLENKSLNTGDLQLAAQINTLADVSVSAMRPIIKQEVDKITYDIQADPESKALTALDMMRKVPMLSVDAEDNIKLKGSDNFKILINGKPSSMLERNPKDVLRAMPASSIQKIEVITNPPAKYDSEGLSGIINIITNKKIDNGYNGNLNLRHQIPFGGPSIGGSVAFKQGKFGVNAYAGTGFYHSPTTESISSRITTGTNPSDLLNIGKRKIDNNYRYGGADLSYELDSLNLFTAGFNPYSGYNENFNAQKFNLTTPGLITSYNLNSKNRYEWNGLELSFNYQRGFKSNKDQLLTFSYKYSDGGNPQKNTLTFLDRVNFNDPNYIQTNNSKSKEQTIQLDYVYPVKKLNIEAGIKAILRDNASNFEYQNYNPLLGQYVVDLSKTNLFNNTQNIISAYNSYAYNLTDYAFKLGIRIEETFVKANFISNASHINTDYFNIIPSFSINRKFKNQSSVNFGFTQRIQRPGIYNMNPFVDRSMPNYESTGNPNLKAVLANNLELTYSKFGKGSVNVGFNYNFSNNTIQNISVYNASSGITRSSFANIGKNKTLSTNLNVNYPLTTKWKMSLNGNIGYVWLEGVINGNLIQKEGMKGYVYLSTNYTFEKQWRANASLSYNAPYLSLQGKSNANLYVYFGGSKELIKDKLTFSLGINDPFHKFRIYENTTTGTNFIQKNKFQNYDRSLSGSLNWKFGSLKDAIKKNQRSINNDDKSGGSNSGQ